MKTKLIQVTTKGEFQHTVADYLGKGYSVVDRSDKTAVLRIMNRLNRGIFFLLLICAVFPAIIYLLLHMIFRRNELVTVELTNV